jgi:hypothetical protein
MRTPNSCLRIGLRLRLGRSLLRHHVGGRAVVLGDGGRRRCSQTACEPGG